jgi:hypothetical protein
MRLDQSNQPRPRSEWGDAFPDNRILGAATLDRLRHGAYRVVIEGESFRKPKPMPENSENAVAKSGKNTHFLRDSGNKATESAVLV